MHNYLFQNNVRRTNNENQATVHLISAKGWSLQGVSTKSLFPTHRHRLAPNWRYLRVNYLTCQGGVLPVDRYPSMAYL